MLQAEKAHLEEDGLAVFSTGKAKQARSRGGLADGEGTTDHANYMLRVVRRRNEGRTGEDREELLRESLTMMDSHPASRTIHGRPLKSERG